MENVTKLVYKCASGNEETSVTIECDDEDNRVLVFDVGSQIFDIDSSRRSVACGTRDAEGVVRFFENMYVNFRQDSGSNSIVVGYLSEGQYRDDFVCNDDFASFHNEVVDIIWRGGKVGVGQYMFAFNGTM
jgi:hypothetical protein